MAGGFARSLGSALDWVLELTRLKSIECLHLRGKFGQREQPVVADVNEVAAPGRLTSVVRQGSEYLMSLRPLAMGLPVAR